MVSQNRKKMLGFVFTLLAFLIFGGLSTTVIVFLLQEGSSLPIEAMTLVVLQAVAFLLLLIGIVAKKENLVLGTLVAALASSVVSYSVQDVTKVISSSFDFTGPWYASAYQVSGLIGDGFLAVATISFLIYLLSGRHAGSRSTTSILFVSYLLVGVLEILFLIIGMASNEEYLLILLAVGSDFVAALAYIFDIDGYFFRKDNPSLAARIRESKSQRQAKRLASKKALSSLDGVIADYQKNILSSAFKIKDSGLELTVDLRTVPLYEDCSGGTLLNNAIYSFVEDAAFALGEGQALSLRFLFPEGMEEEEKKRVAAIFRAHYAIRYKNLKDRLAKEMILAITFVFIGFLLITIHLPYVSADSNSVYGEMLDIFGWVFAWEAVEILCVNSLDNQNELRSFQLLYTAAIEEDESKEIEPKA
jgi:hypothetical protein